MASGGTDPYARWCGRGDAARCPPIPISDPKPPFAAREKSATRVQVFGPLVRKRRRVCAICVGRLPFRLPLCLQLAFELARKPSETPVRFLLWGKNVISSEPNHAIV
jgi:hypothetical protein